MRLGDDENADARAFGDRLDHIGPRHEMAFGRLEPRHHPVVGDRHAGGTEQDFGEILLHGDGRGHDAGMAVGNAENLQDALQRAVLAGPAVQHIERDIGLGGGQRRGHIGGHIDRGDAIAEPVESVGTSLAGAQRHVALRRPATHQDGHVLCQSSPYDSASSADSHGSRIKSTIGEKSRVLVAGGPRDGEAVIEPGRRSRHRAGKAKPS